MGSGAEPQPKSNFVHFTSKIWHLVATILMIYLIINWPNLKQFKQYRHFMIFVTDWHGCTFCSLIIGGARLMHGPFSKILGPPDLQDRRPWRRLYDSFLFSLHISHLMMITACALHTLELPDWTWRERNSPRNNALQMSAHCSTV